MQENGQIYFDNEENVSDGDARRLEAERKKLETDISEEYKKGLEELRERVNKLLPGKTYGPGFPD